MAAGGRAHYTTALRAAATPTPRSPPRPAPPTTRPRPPASGRSPSRCRTTCTSRARADGRRTSRRRCRTPTWSSTSTTSTQRHRPLITRQGHLVRERGRLDDPARRCGRRTGSSKAGHRIGVRVTDNNQDWWLLAAPTLQTVMVRGGSVTLPFLRYRRTQTIQGDPGIQLAGYLSDTVTVPAADSWRPRRPTSRCRPRSRPPRRGRSTPAATRRPRPPRPRQMPSGWVAWDSNPEPTD